jgi:orotate phosphoribosyltransferase-like protein
MKTQAVRNLGRYAVGFGEVFERKVRKLFEKGLTDAAIAQTLNVGRATVTYLAMHWRKPKRKNKR